MNLQEQPYKVVPDGVYFYGLTIVLDGVYRLMMWNDLLGIEGTECEVKLTFRLHDVVIRGSGLLQLFRDAKRHKIDILTVMPRHRVMQGGEGLIIEEIRIKAAEV